MNKIIRASAGTGKTFRVSLEYISLLIQGVSFQEIVALTFTRKATAEIRNRISEHLDFLINGKSESVEHTLKEILPKKYQDKLKDKEYLAGIYNELNSNKHKIAIHTIDSFINRIFNSLIVPYLHVYGYEQIDDTQNQDYIEQVLMHLLQNRILWKKIKIFFKKFKKIKNFQDYLSFINYIIYQRWKIEKIKDHSQIETPKISKQELVSSFQKILQIIYPHSSFTSLNKGFEFINPELLTKDDLCLQIILEHSRDFLQKANFWNKRKINDPNLPGKYEKFKIFLAEYLFEQQVSGFYTLFQESCELIYKIYDAIKLSEKKFTYADINYYTYKYLYSEEISVIDREQETVLNIFYELLVDKFSFLLIDEFQDTSILQWRILTPLIKEMVAAQGKGVICVGDEKQAIYGWRGGERQILLNLQQFLGIVSQDCLDTSFRSSPAIVNFINDYFAAISRHTAKFSINWSYQPVLCHNDGCIGSINFKLFPKKSANQDNIFNDIAQELRQNIELNYIKENDTAILVRTNAEMELMGIALAEQGISYVLESASSVFDYKAIKPIIIFLRYLVYRDIFDLFSYLRTDLVGLANADLQQILLHYRQLSKEQKYNLELYADFKEVQEIIDFIKFLDRSLPLDRIMGDIIEFMGVCSRFKTNYDSKNIFRFLTIVKEYASNKLNAQNLLGLLKFIEKNRQGENYRQESFQNSHAIKIMTIHKAKGLEFENVIFYWEIARSKKNNDIINIATAFNPVFSQISQSLVYLNRHRLIIENLPAAQQLLLEEQKKILIEELNNTYVTLTRAKKNLFIYGITGKKITDLDKLKPVWPSWSDALYHLHCQSLLASFKKEKMEDFAEKANSIGSLSYSDKYLAVAEQQIDVAVLSQLNTAKLMKYTDSKVLKQKYEKYLFAGQKYVTGQLIGNIVHDYLSYIKYDSDQEHEIAFKRMMYKYGSSISLEYLNMLVSKIKDFIRVNQKYFSDKWEVYTEYVLYEGNKEYRLDRINLNRAEKLLYIIDYKTGYHDDQLTVYKNVVSKMPYIREQDFKIKAMFLEIDV